MSKHEQHWQGERYQVLVPYSYEHEGEVKTAWTRVGTALTSKDGEGFNIELRPGIAVNGRLIVRPFKAKEGDGESPAAAEEGDGVAAGEPEGGCHFNPLHEIRFETNYQVSDAEDVARRLIDTDGKGLVDHWQKAGAGLLTGLILHALYKGKRLGVAPSLPALTNMLSGVNRQSLFEEMRDVECGGQEAELDAQRTIQSTGKQMLNTPPRELGSIISTALNCMQQTIEAASRRELVG